MHRLGFSRQIQQRYLEKFPSSVEVVDDCFVEQEFAIAVALGERPDVPRVNDAMLKITHVRVLNRRRPQVEREIPHALVAELVRYPESLHRAQEPLSVRSERPRDCK